MLTQKQEDFTVHYFKTRHATNSAIAAGYAPRAAYAMASENLTKPQIQERLRELRAESLSDAVADVQERQERLTEILRARLTNFVDQNGNITLETENNGALQAVEIEDWHGIKGEEDELSRTKKVKLHNPITAIAELNKMDHIYDEKPQDNRSINFNFIIEDRETEEVVKKILSGKLPMIEEKDGQDSERKDETLQGEEA